MNQENDHVLQPHFSFDAFSSSSSVVTRFGCGSSGLCEPSQAQMLPSTNEYIFGSTDDQPIPLQAGSVVQGNYGDEYTETTRSKSSEILEKYCSTSAAADTFVEDILAHDAEMRLQFPDIFGENYADC